MKRPTKAGLTFSQCKDLALWRRNIDGALGFMEQLQALSEGKSTRWTLGMRTHYTKKLKQLLAHTPKGGEASARFYRQRLKALAVD